MAAPNIPSPIYANQGGGGGGNFLEQLLLTLASQSPGMLMTHLARKDEQRKEAAAGVGAQAALAALLSQAQGDPTLAPVAQGIGAFQAQPQDMQLRAAPGALTDLSGLMTTLAQRDLMGKQGDQAAALAGESQARTQTENDLRDARIREAEAVAGIQEIEHEWRARVIEADINQKNAIASANWREAERIDQGIEIERQDALLRQLNAEQALYLESIKTIPALFPGIDGNTARVMGSMIAYDAPTPPSRSERLAELSQRFGAPNSDLAAERRQRVITGIQQEFSDFDESTAATLDVALRNSQGIGQTALDGYLEVNAGQIDAGRAAMAAMYLTAVTGQPVRPPQPAPPGVGERLKSWLQRQMQEQEDLPDPVGRGLESVDERLRKVLEEIGARVPGSRNPRQR